jgi:Na+/proline symporter
MTGDGGTASVSIVLWAAGSAIALLGIGVWAARRTRDARDYFLAGQRLGVWVTGIAAASAAFSGFVFLGGPGLAYRIGVASWFIVLPVGITPALLGYVAARRLREAARDGDVLTIPDVFRARWPGRSVPALAAVAILIGTVGYLGAQVLAAGRLLQAILGAGGDDGGWSLPLAIGIGLAVVLTYSVAGGMVAGVYTDVLQGILMAGTAIALGVVGLRAAGGWSEAVRAVVASDRFGAAWADPLGQVPAATLAGFLFLFGVGVLGQPHMLHKFLMIRDPERLRFLPAVLGGSQALCLVVWIGLGLAVPALVSLGQMDPPSTPDAAVPAFLAAVAPPALSGLAVAGAFAAILSTSDSFLNLGAAALTRDLPRAFGRGLRDELRAARIATVVLGVAAGVVAWLRDDLIALLGTFAFGTFAAALAPAVALGFGWQRVSGRVAGASIAAGLVVQFGLELGHRLPGGSNGVPAVLTEGAQPSAVALAVSFGVLAAGAWWFPARSSIAVGHRV